MLNMVNFFRVLAVLLVFSVVACDNTSWEKVYGGDNFDTAKSVIETADGGFLAAGNVQTRSGYSDYTIRIMKLNASGEQQWEKEYGGNAAIASLVKAAGGGYILAGSKKESSTNSVLVLKINDSGDEEWSKTFMPGDEYNFANAIAAASHGGSILTGSTGLYPDCSNWIIKLDSLGNEEWSQLYDADLFREAADITEAHDGGYILAGYIFSSSSQSNALIVKIDSSGSIEWSRTCGDGYSSLRSVEKSSNGGYIAGGKISEESNSLSNALVVKLGVSGEVEWLQSYGDSSENSIYSITDAHDGGYIFAGNTGDFNTQFTSDDGWVVKLDSQGNSQWEKRRGTQSRDDDLLRAIIKTSDGGYAAAGATSSSGAGYYDFWILKFDRDGN
ncbi:MAG: hypothetical protein GY754_45970 [bacterium]|nr:hypothetical protein [bacterium]